MPFSRKSEKSVWLGLAALFALMALAVWLYTGPQRALAQAHAALIEQDVRGLEARVDFPALREQIKSDLAAEAIEAMGTGVGGHAGAMMGLALAGPVIDALITPQGLIAFTREAQQYSKASPGSPQASQQWDEWMEEGKITTRFASTTRAEVSLTHSSTPSQALIVLMDRQGLGWRVVGGRIDSVR